MNLIIDDTDHSLIIKVASIQQARMQIYFIDNEDYFHRKATMQDADGKFFKDNDERMIFFARGVIETVKKLRWSPDIIHCHGWFTSDTSKLSVGRWEKPAKQNREGAADDTIRDDPICRYIFQHH